MKTLREIIGFTEDEIKSIITAGKILREALNKVSSKDIAVSLYSEDFKLVETLQEVSKGILDNCQEQDLYPSDADEE